MKYLVGIFLGIALSLTSVYLYTQKTWVAVSCDVDKYIPAWFTLSDILESISNPNSGLHCLRGAIIVQAPNIGELYNQTINYCTEEYGYVPEGLKGFK